MEPTLSQDSPAWLFFVHAAFVVALGGMIYGILALDAASFVKGYLGMGLFFTVSATLTLSKTIRDNHEAQKLHHKIAEVKTASLLKEYERTN